MSDAVTDFDPETHTLVQEFPILYGTEKNGKTKVWIAKIYLKGKHTSASVLSSSQIHALATIEHGQLEGKKQLTIRDYTEGKNIGKKNETTPLQQCIAETKRKWTDKHEKESYQETMTTDQAQTQAQAQAPATEPSAKKYFPMLAHTFEPATTAAKKNNIVFPCFVQPKLDGLRCIMYRDPVTGELHCQSRTGSYFDTMDHIKTSLVPVFAKHPNTIFDGELYTTEIPFEELAGLIKKKKLTPADKERLCAIEYHIYDIVDETKPFEERHAMIRKIFAQYAASRMASPHAHAHAQAPNSDHMPHLIRLVPTTEAKTPADFRAQFSEFIEAGYEGIMLRNKKGVYRCNYRSHDLQKYKEFLEDEFPIVGFTQGDGRDKGTIIWICVTKEGKEFSVRPRGTMEHRRKLFQTGEKYVGKKLTIIYQELTEEGKPRFPVGKDVRDKY